MPLIKEEPVHSKIKTHLFNHGLKQTWLSTWAKINRTELSRKLSGNVLFTDAEIKRINKVLKTKFKI